MECKKMDSLCRKNRKGKEKKEWICSICGHRYFGSEAPASCPVCSAGREYFDEVF